MTIARAGGTLKRFPVASSVPSNSPSVMFTTVP
ncbi:MAG: hypothetical protein QOK11_3301 [Pseudonocardiales bacterium]|nr:hypothetical protein [Pseudonocardiales bacterium]